jgi:hypothetical protein
MDHTVVTATACATCHDGGHVSAGSGKGIGKNTTHVPTTVTCDSCHASNKPDWKPASMSHTAVAAAVCASCHDGSHVIAGTRALGKHTNHVATTATCETCHTTTAWKPATFNHTAAGVNAGPGTCNTCHDGTQARGVTAIANHIATAAIKCDSCHKNYTSFKPAAMDHTVVTATACATCHDGGHVSAGSGKGIGKNTTHVPTTVTCDSCHASNKPDWKPASMSHTAVAAAVCASCHDGAHLTSTGKGLGKSATHVPTTATCETCHSTTAWKPATYVHPADAAGRCNTCHTGSNGGMVQNSTHVPTSSVQCESCHKNFTAFKPANMDHTSVAATACATCHSGSFVIAGTRALGMNTNHVPTTATCGSCHSSSKAAWKPAVMSHIAVTGNVCANCHDGAHLTSTGKGLGKSATHVPTTATCDTCHTTTAWKPATYVHPADAAGRCNTCHTGSNGGLVQNSTHVPTTAVQCDSCHKNFTAFKPANMDHTMVAATACATCHNGNYTIGGARVLTKSARHVPTTAGCDSCHTSSKTAWTPAAMSHTAVVGTACVNCHDGAHLTSLGKGLGKTGNHVPTTATCENCHSSSKTTWTPATMSHAAVVGSVCSSCHDGAHITSTGTGLGKSATHVATTATCDTCHSTTAWKPATYVHPADAAGRCITCHTGTGGGLVQNSTHVPTSTWSVQCDKCHNNFTTFKPANMDHTSVVSTACATCHNGSYVIAGTRALGKNTNHVPTTATCDSCHSSSKTAWKPAVMSHAVVAGSVCASCHDGAHLTSTGKGLGKSATHVATVATCDTCHTTTAWKPATYVHPADAVGRCNTCHTGTGGGLVQNSTHVPTAAVQCESCHKNFTAFKPANMDHTSVTATACATCHSGGYVISGTRALGKNTNHVPTTATCDSCHSKIAWKPATMSHTAVTGNVCANCHDGAHLTSTGKGLGKSATHVATTATCDTCHSTTAWKPATYVHPADAAGRCNTCHTGTGGGLVQNSTHVPTATVQCDSCHKNFNLFKPANMDHTSVAATACATCHSGGYVISGTRALGKSARHVPTTAGCDSCHTSSKTAWTPAAMSHTAVVGTACVSCHDGAHLTSLGKGLGKTGNHVPTTATCENCHSSSKTTWTPATMSHAAVVGSVCVSCHDGAHVTSIGTGLGKSATHVATTAACDTCHLNTTTWTGALYTHPADAAGRCASCHTGTGGGKVQNITHVPIGVVQCDGCHKNFTAFKPANMDHTMVVGTACSTCHNGNYTIGGTRVLTKSARHVPTTAGCDSCHTSSKTAWTPAAMSHTAVVGTACVNCHDGAHLTSLGKGLGKTGNHVPTTATCENCHSSSKTTWTPATMSHAAVVGSVCSSCHDGAHITSTGTGLGKSATHVATTATCDTCHSTTAWKPATYVHPADAAGRCITCHTGTGGGLVQNSTHVPTSTWSVQCDKCHNNFTTFKPANMDHTSVVSTACATCHNGSYVIAGTRALGKNTNHVPTTATCDSCHSSSKTAWKPAVMSHAVVAGSVCASCHDGAHLTSTGKGLGKSATHVATVATCDTCHTTTAWKPATYVHPADAVGRCNTCHTGTGGGLVQNSTHVPTAAVQCESCHKNFTAFKPANMDHTSVTATACATCHSGGYVISGTRALGKNTNHVPTTATCDSCHSKIAWKPATMSHTAVTGNVCANCHDGAHLTSTGKGLGKSATHVATTATCDTCHSTTAWKPATYVHPADAAGRCNTCHTGTGGGLVQNSTHVPTATVQCDSCHKNFNLFKPANMDHTSVAATACATCHSGGYVISGTRALGKSARHVPTTAGCDSCHTSSKTAWTPAAMSHTAVVGTACVSCHDGAHLTSLGKGLGKTGNHVPTTATCENCHSSSKTTWTPATMSHAAVVGSVCVSCHDGAHVTSIGTGLGKSATHVATTAACDTCHLNTTTWTGALYTHPADAAGRCASCHTGTGGGKVQNITHVPIGVVQCDGCHKNFTAFKPANMDHTMVVGTACSTCHNGNYTIGGTRVLTKSARHVPTTAGCDSCHTSSKTAWTPAAMSHTVVVGTACVNCHDGAHLTSLGKGLGKTGSHVPTTATCDSCHSSSKTTWTPATMNHAAVVGSVCSSCHDGAHITSTGKGLGKSATHVATTAACDTCHLNTTTWTGALFTHPADAAGRCASCHTGSGGGKVQNITHVPIGVIQCDGCHKTFTAFKPANMDHTMVVATACSTCHNGNYMIGGTRVLTKSARHVPTSAGCDSCHTSSKTAWTPAAMNHAVAVGTGCINCHDGTHMTSLGKGLGKTGNHVPTTATCDSCHSSSKTVWTPATMSHAVVVGNACVGCHDGAHVTSIGTGVGKSATHVATTAACDSCHLSTTTWTGALFTHPADAAGRCASCHTGSGGGKVQNITHVPIGVIQCDGCHKTFTAFKPANMDHTVVAATACSTCHNGNYTIGGTRVLTKNTNHVPTTAGCDSCHTSSRTAWKPAAMNHTVVVGTACVTCHDGAHLTSTGGGKGKTATHIPTATLVCDTCHKTTTAWLGSKNDHAAAAGAGLLCATCHNGSYPAAKGKSAIHVVTTDACDVCHKSTTVWTASYTHPADAAGRCNSCHTGTGGGKVQNSTHVPTGALQCESCHKNFTAFKPANMDHASVLATACSTCHNGSYVIAGTRALGKNANHILTTATCDNCHSSSKTAWKPAAMNHVVVVGTACATCHDGAHLTSTGTGKGKTANHIPTATLVCDTCHKTTTAWLGSKNDHAAAAGAGLLCATCHNGSYPAARTKSATHVVTAAACDTCHFSTVTWSATFVHPADAAGRCITCHTGTGGGLVQNSTHVPTTAVQCDSCHKNFTAFKPANMDHTSVVATACSTCHNGSYVIAGTRALGKNVNHVPTTATCDSCHSSSKTAWKPAVMSHTAVTGSICSGCHDGAHLTSTGTALGKPVNHVATTAACDTCHTPSNTANFTKWTGAVYVHPADATGRCNSCHTGTGGGKVQNSTHVPTAAVQCESCHKNFTAFKPANMDHTSVVATACSTCHNGSYVIAGTRALGKNANHVPTTATCDSCHSSSNTAWKPATMSHTAVTGNICSGCHDGAHLTSTGKGLGKPVNHVATTAACDTCHTPSNTANFTKWTGAVYVHPADAIGRCVSCHTGTGGGKVQNTTHVPTAVVQCDNCHKNYTAFKPANMTHSSVVATPCATCHNGSYVLAGTRALGKNSTHVPTAVGCDNCHTSSLTAWKPAAMSHAAVAGSACDTCHSGGYVIGGTRVLGKTANHVPIPGGVTCDNCHSSARTDWKSWVMSHTAVVVAACGTCHTGTFPNGRGKPATGHIPTTAGCDSCHGAPPKTWAQWTMNHLVVTGTCTSCHGGAYADVKVKPTGNLHIPTSTVDCGSCHASYTTFTAWSMVTGHTAVTGIIACATCHTGTYPNGKAKPTTGHIPVQTTAACSGCHTSTTSWATWKMDHTLGNPNSSTSCITCHGDGSAKFPSVSFKSSTHFVTTAACETCHTSKTSWTTVSYAHKLTQSSNGTPNATAGYWPGGSRHTGLTCKTSACHSGNTQAVTWRDAGFKNSCAGCHTNIANHNHTATVTPASNYTAATLEQKGNCAGPCHTYAATIGVGTPTTTRNGPQHTPSGSF